MEKQEAMSFYDIHLPLGDTHPSFNLVNAVCSHGLFMMSPNKWDPETKSFTRPLRLSLDHSPSPSAHVRVSQNPSTHALLVRVYGTSSLSQTQQDAVVAQVRRMLRLSKAEEKAVREFQEMCPEAKARGFGRVFRSPNLFEDMVKCILLCNCQWSRTLSMAKALCDLQLELQCQSSAAVSENAIDDKNAKLFANESAGFIPGTPAVKESKRKRKLEIRDACEESGTGLSEKTHSMDVTNGMQLTEKPKIISESSTKFEIVNGSNHSLQHSAGCSEVYKQERVQYCTELVGNFPCPEEIASLDEIFLSKRCGLGYRAGRILKLAQGVCDGRIQLGQLEKLCSDFGLSNCNEVDEKLQVINGFGPFTRRNVLMCMGFYNAIPTDSETIRHLQKVHGKKTTIQSVQKVVDDIYGGYKHYQFLAYWSELWNFYEDWFGKLSEMQPSDYKLITASKMRTNQKFGQ